MKSNEFLDAARTYLERLGEEKMSGNVTFGLHMKDGGIGRVEVNIKHDLKAPAPSKS